MEDILNELIKKMNKQGYEEINGDKEELNRKLNILTKDAFCLLAVSNNGQLIIGNEPAILSCISTLIYGLKDKIDKEKILEAVKDGFTGPKATKKDIGNLFEE